MEDITYRTATVCAVSGLEASTLRTLRARDQLPALSESGGWTKFTFEDLVAIDTMMRLTRRYAMSNERACGIAKRVAAIASGASRVTRGGRGRSHLEAGMHYLVIIGDEDPIAMPESGIAHLLGASDFEGDAIVIDAKRVRNRILDRLRELDEPLPEEVPAP